MTKFVEISKQSKKAQKEHYKKQRVMNGFNTGIRTMKTEKNLSRNQRKALDRKEIMCYN